AAALFAASIGPAYGGRHRHAQAGADPPEGLRADVRAQVGDGVRRLRKQWRLLSELCGGRRHRPHHSRRRLCAWLSAAARNSDRRDHAAAGQDRAREAPDSDEGLLMVAIFETIVSELGPLGAGTAVGVEHELLVLRTEPVSVLPLARRLKSDWRFDLLLDVTAIDWPQRTPRFDVVWHFYSTVHKVRVRIKVQVAESDPVVDSMPSLSGSAAFSERESHEMYGIDFRGNADLRPILLYEGFVGYPLRKDYPKQAEPPRVKNAQGL